MKKKNKRISLHQRLSLYNIMAAVAPVFLAICIMFIFTFSLIHIIYRSGNPNVTNPRDIITVSFCQFNIRKIEQGLKNADGEKAPNYVEKACKSLENSGFSVCVRLGGEIMYISEGRDDEYFEDLNAGIRQHKDGFVFIDSGTMQIQSVDTDSQGQEISVTLKSTGNLAEKRTSAALTLWHFSGIFLLGMFTIVILAVIIDIFIARSMAKSVISPLENLRKAAERIKLGSLDEPVEIDDSTQELGDLCIDFEEMRVQLKKSVDAKAEYEKVRQNTYSGLNHDIRTAVTTIKGYTQGLKDGIANTPEKRERYINAISLSTESLEKLVDALSEITNLETNTVSFHLKERDMYSVLTKWYEESCPSFEARNIGFSMAYNCDKRVFCKIDTFQFERIVDNILTNCVKYKKPESDHIDVSVTASLSGDGMYQLVYADNGIGVSSEDAQRVFDIFFRADEARTNVQRGSGIGLSIVKQIILRHGGTITAGGEKGKGLTLTIKLPISRMEDL